MIKNIILETQLFINKVPLDTLVVQNIQKEIDEISEYNLNLTQKIDEDILLLKNSKTTAQLPPSKIKAIKIKSLKDDLKTASKYFKLNKETITSVNNLLNKLLPKIPKGENIKFGMSPDSILCRNYSYYLEILQQRNKELAKEIVGLKEDILTHTKLSEEIYNNASRDFNILIEKRIKINEEERSKKTDEIIALQNVIQLLELKNKKPKKERK